MPDILFGVGQERLDRWIVSSTEKRPPTSDRVTAAVECECRKKPLNLNLDRGRSRWSGQDCRSPPHVSCEPAELLRVRVNELNGRSCTGVVGGCGNQAHRVGAGSVVLADPSRDVGL